MCDFCSVYADQLLEANVTIKLLQQKIKALEDLNTIQQTHIFELQKQLDRSLAQTDEAVAIANKLIDMK